MDLFMKAKFTGLQQNTTLLSLGLVAEDGRSFYAEFTDYDESQCDGWLYDNVFPKLELKDNCFTDILGCVNVRHNTRFITAELEEWLEQFENVVIWSDCGSHDWVLFCELFGGALRIPKNVYYIPMDLCTLLLTKGVDPDISRVEFVDTKFIQHHALDNARIIKACHEKLMSIVPV